MILHGYPVQIDKIGHHFSWHFPANNGNAPQHLTVMWYFSHSFNFPILLIQQKVHGVRISYDKAAETARETACLVCIKSLPVEKTARETACLDCIKPLPVEKTARETVCLDCIKPLPVEKTARETACLVCVKPLPVEKTARETACLICLKPLPVEKHKFQQLMT